MHVPLPHRKAPLPQETAQLSQVLIIIMFHSLVLSCPCPLGGVDGWARDYMFQELVIMVEKLTAVSLITSIRASPNSSAS